MGVMLLVANLSAEVTDNDLIVGIGDYGIVESVTMDCGSLSESGHQSARVVMSNNEEAQAVIDWLHDTKFKGRIISVARV